VSLEDIIVRGSRRNNANTGAGYFERNGEQNLIRVPGQVTSLDDLRAIIIKGHRHGELTPCTGRHSMKA